MRIKALDIAGFKSFAEPAHLSFGPGITGVVGPNGCGKSNIIDAIRWVMGEMSAKHLRGKAMQDVIFAGSESRGPSGMAEVTLTFHNDGDVPPQYASYTDIAVTRRLHRDGTSDYLINKVPARLRDITDLFLGTGVGTRAYSIIEQGRIGFIVSARPEDRRSLIEEVAGITKFKVRRKAAERRMIATEQNLARVNDIIAELERQLGSLRRQAKKAERYKRVKAELRDLDLHVATMRLLELRVLERQLLAARAELEAKLEDTTREVEGHEASLEAERLAQLEKEERLQAEQKRSAEVESKLAALERDLSHWKRQAEDARERAIQANAEVTQAQQRLQEMGSERTGLDEKIATMDSQIQNDRDRLEAARAAVEEVQLQLGSADKRLEELRQRSVEVVHEVAQQRTHLAGLQKRQDDLSNREVRATEERGGVESRLEEARGRQQALHERREQLVAELASWTARRDELTRERSDVHRQVTESEEKILELRSNLAESRSRLESLEEIARRLEGYSQGVRSLLNGSTDENNEHPEPAVAGILGLVTDLLQVQPEYEQAIEALLGDKLQGLVVEHEGVSVDAIRYLRRTDGGRSGLIPKNPKIFKDRNARDLSGEGEGEGEGEGGSGLVTNALQVVTVKPGFEAVAEMLLGNAVVVDSLDSALEIWRRIGPDQTLVTRDGEVLEPSGALSGGSEAGAGLLAQAREIRELREVVERLAGELSLASSAHRELESKRLQLDVDIQQLDKDIRQSEIERVELDKDLEAVAGELQRLSERQEVLSLELGQFHEELAGLAQELAETEERLQVAQTRQAELQEEVTLWQDRRAQHAAELEERSQGLTTLKVQLAQSDEKLSSARSAIERIDQAESDFAQRIERGQRLLAESQALEEELMHKISEGIELKESTAAEAQALRERLSEARAAYDLERTRMQEIEAQVREQRRSSELVRESLTELKMDLQRSIMERDKLVERVAERHDVDLLTVAGDYHLRPLPNQEDMKRRDELERSLKSMGSINLTAIEECAEVEARYTFLTAQRDDLTGALDSLRKAIQRINRTSRQRFQDAFNAVNQMFQQVFPRLFRGGEARLELLSHDDVLEAGVDIIAQPPGKKLQNVGLLSGGEKALTATALVFAIFLIKPSPFCVLDEVDAPLDDANVGRFNEMLREISKISQFIVITHNKLTMTEADRLYGITMDEPGMSKLVSVDLKDDKGDKESAAA